MELRVTVPTRMLAGALIAVALLAGCSSDSSDSSSDGSSDAAVCAAAKKLQRSVDQLVSNSTLTGGRSGISDAVDRVKADLDALGQAAKDDIEPNVTVAKEAVRDLRTTIAGLGSGSITGNLEALGTAISKVGSAADAVATSVQPNCPS